MTSNLGIIWITTILLVGKRIGNNQATWLNSLTEERTSILQVICGQLEWMQM